MNGAVGNPVGPPVTETAREMRDLLFTLFLLCRGNVCAQLFAKFGCASKDASPVQRSGRP